MRISLHFVRILFTILVIDGSDISNVQLALLVYFTLAAALLSRLGRVIRWLVVGSNSTVRHDQVDSWNTQF